MLPYAEVMDVLGYTEIPHNLILKRWTRDATDVLLPHLQIYQRDHAGSRTMINRHTTLYVHAMKLVRLDDASAQAYEKWMKIIRDGIAALAEYEDSEIWFKDGRQACSSMLCGSNM